MELPSWKGPLSEHNRKYWTLTKLKFGHVNYSPLLRQRCASCEALSLASRLTDMRSSAFQGVSESSCNIACSYSAWAILYRRPQFAGFCPILCICCKTTVRLQSFWALGALAEVALASTILVPYGWRWLLGSAAVPFGACTTAPLHAAHKCHSGAPAMLTFDPIRRDCTDHSIWLQSAGNSEPHRILLSTQSSSWVRS